MSEILNWPLIITYSLYSSFSAFQKFCVRDYKGHSEFYKNILATFTFITQIFGLVFLIYYGFQTTWWSPLLLYGLGLLSYLLLGFIENLIPIWILGASSFIVVPCCGFLMIVFAFKNVN